MGDFRLKLLKVDAGVLKLDQITISKGNLGQEVT